MSNLSEQVRELEAKLDAALNRAKKRRTLCDQAVADCTAAKSRLAQAERERDEWRKAAMFAEVTPTVIAQARAEGAREALTKLETQLEASRDNGIWYGTIVLEKVREFRNREYPAPARGEQGTRDADVKIDLACRAQKKGDADCICPPDVATPSPVERVTPEPLVIPLTRETDHFTGITITPELARRIVSLAAQDGGTRDA